MSLELMKALGAALSLAATPVLAPAAHAKDWKTVVIAMEGAYAPWNLTESSGKIVGFEPDLAVDLCKRAGLECKIIAQDWDGMIPGLKAGKFDVIMDGMSITDARKKEIDFTRPYATPGASFLAPNDSPLAKTTGAGALIHLDKDPAAGEAAIKSVQAALEGKTLGVQVSTIHANFANQYLKGVATIREYKTIDERDIDLETGRLDAVLDDYTANAAAAEKPDAKGLAIVGPRFTGGVFGVGAGMGFRKSDADLTARFDKALAEAVADGSVKKYSERWFKVDVTPRS
jgi:octopine/nopaline transport system substrate-binding protein